MGRAAAHVFCRARLPLRAGAVRIGLQRLHGRGTCVAARRVPHGVGEQVQQHLLPQLHGDAGADAGASGGASAAFGGQRLCEPTVSSPSEAAGVHRTSLLALLVGTATAFKDVECRLLAFRALVWRAARAQPVDRPLPTAFVEYRGRLFPEELEKQATPGELAAKAISTAPLDAAMTAITDRVRKGELGPWPPTSAWVGRRCGCDFQA